ncbi:signal peptide containing protein [Theileria equi strain WA]|uniref:Signal peptide containing protein n=1 Tax=Theileria equi strain WA TaxID=1537102 RepID=L1LAW0_THEEQ|nr:signal peptide containing protein [Theileria equi strain WA]EKX72420.1 signal peptide containing protein [Theileria equi strain WA]|eukprot:XP_004831872.1 signal peptide containing protein [Theileria equi strain WA]
MIMTTLVIVVFCIRLCFVFGLHNCNERDSPGTRLSRGKADESADFNGPQTQHTYILDIMDPDIGLVSVQEGEQYGVHQKSYHPMAGKKITVLAYGKTILWEETSATRFLYLDSFAKNGKMLLSLCLLESGDIEYHYLKHANNVWTRLSEMDFCKEYTRMRGRRIKIPLTSSQDVSSTYTEYGPEDLTEFENEAEKGRQEMHIILDIAKPDEKITVSESEIDGVSYKGYFMGEALTLSSLSEKGVEIWNASPGNECKFVYLCTSGKTSLMILDIHRNGRLHHMHFRKNGKRWERISTERFDAYFKNMMDKKEKRRASRKKR